MGRLPLCLAFLIGTTCSFAADVTKLALIKDAEFSQWLLGAEWEFSPANGKTRKLWFPTSDVVICARSEEKAEKMECGYSFIIQKKGVMRCFADTSGKRTLDLTLADDTAKGMVKDSDTGKSYPLKFIGRRSLPAEPKKTRDEFASWLKGKSVGNGAANSYSFGSDATVLGSGKDAKPFRFEILRPGLVKYLYAGNPYDPKLIAFSPDLKKARSWAWWGTIEFPVTDREPAPAPAPAGAGVKDPEVKKAEPFSMLDMKEILLAAKSATVNALLVQDIGNCRYAGKPSRLSLSAVPFDGAKPATVAFNQDAGSVMEKALNEMARFEALCHGGWPRGQEVQLSFAAGARINVEDKKLRSNESFRDDLK